MKNLENLGLTFQTSFLSTKRRKDRMDLHLKKRSGPSHNNNNQTLKQDSDFCRVRSIHCMLLIVFMLSIFLMGMQFLDYQEGRCKVITFNIFSETTTRA